MLVFQAEKQLGEFSVNVSFTSDTGATALFGPSGAGKTSVINMIAGLLNPERGRIVLDGDVLFDSAKRINVPAWRRRTLIVTLLWNFVHLLTAPAVAFWVIYAREEVGLDAHAIGDIVFWAYVAGAFGNFLGGFLIDRIGRRWTCALFYTLGSVALVSLFHARGLFVTESR